jgi:galactokinase
MRRIMFKPVSVTRDAGRGEFIGEAHARVNLIGEHTDYHQGFVLPTLMPQRTTARLQLRTDRLVLARSTIGEAEHSFVLGDESPGLGWIDYVQGVTAVAARSGLALPGFSVAIDSDVPVGAGVSSSAALTVALWRALRAALRLAIDDIEIARLSQRVETEFVGVPVGIMDQMVCSLGRPDQALFIDTRTLAVEHIPLPSSIELIVIDSGVTHKHSGGGYAARRRESFAAARLLGAEWLRDIPMDQLPRIEALAAAPAKRARHVVTENHRVLEAVKALRAGDVIRLGELLNASHASLRDDYEVSTGEIDALVALGQQDPEVYGARMTGGGFGGAVVMLVRRGRGGVAATRIADAYARRTGLRGSVLMPLETVGTKQARTR